VENRAEEYFLAAIKQNGQALEARMLVDRLFDAEVDGLIVVVGDFNAEAFRILKGDAEDTGNGRLVARSLVPLEHSLPESQRFSVVHRGRKMMLDHPLASRRLLGRYRGASKSTMRRWATSWSARPWWRLLRNPITRRSSRILISKTHRHTCQPVARLLHFCLAGPGE
jgi:hypothetical protein